MDKDLYSKIVMAFGNTYFKYGLPAYETFVKQITNASADFNIVTRDNGNRDFINSLDRNLVKQAILSSGFYNSLKNYYVTLYDLCNFSKHSVGSVVDFKNDFYGAISIEEQMNIFNDALKGKYEKASEDDLFNIIHGKMEEKHVEAFKDVFREIKIPLVDKPLFEKKFEDEITPLSIDYTAEEDDFYNGQNKLMSDNWVEMKREAVQNIKNMGPLNKKRAERLQKLEFLISIYENGNEEIRQFIVFNGDKYLIATSDAIYNGVTKSNSKFIEDFYDYLKKLMSDKTNKQIKDEWFLDKQDAIKRIQNNTPLNPLKKNRIDKLSKLVDAYSNGDDSFQKFIKQNGDKYLQDTALAFSGNISLEQADFIKFFEDTVSGKVQALETDDEYLLERKHDYLTILNNFKGDKEDTLKSSLLQKNFDIIDIYSNGSLEVKDAVRQTGTDYLELLSDIKDKFLSKQISDYKKVFKSLKNGENIPLKLEYLNKKKQFINVYKNSDELERLALSMYGEEESEKIKSR